MNAPARTLKNTLALKLAITAAIFSSAAPSVGIAQERPPYVPTFKWVATPGHPVKAIWNDGREATVKRFRSPTFSLKLPLTVAENTCTSRPANRCQAIVPIRREELALHWTKHPNPKRLNRPVMVVNRSKKYDSSSGKEIAGSETVSKYVAFQMRIMSHHLSIKEYPKASAGLRPLQLECDTLDWLMPENGKIKIQNWNFQDMNSNRETAINENQLTTVASGITFTLDTEAKARLTGIKRIYRNDRETLGLFSRDILMLNRVRVNGDVCSIVINVDFDKADSQATRIIDEKMTLPVGASLPKYILGSDELLKDTYLFSNSLVDSSTRLKDRVPVIEVFAEREIE